MSGDLTEFLCARLDEVEAAANAVAGAALDAHWTPESIAEDERTRVARYGPARVLREVEAKRRIVEDYRIAASAVMRTENASDSMYAGRDAFRSACVTLAAVYSDHPDYRQEWKP